MDTSILPSGALPAGLLTSGVPSFQVPISTPAETQARATFTQLLWALSYPGRRYRLPQFGAQPFASLEFNSALAIAYTLLDLETTFFTPDVRLASALVRSGARQVEAASAAYHFYPSTTTQLDDANKDSARDRARDRGGLLTHASEASVGTLLYPDQAATLVVGCRLGEGRAFRLRGPGIDGESSLRVGGLPAAFWHFREQRVIYPLGWDLFLLDGDEIVGLPRTTVLESDDAEIKSNGAENEGKA